MVVEKPIAESPNLADCLQTDRSARWPRDNHLQAEAERTLAITVSAINATDFPLTAKGETFPDLPDYEIVAELGRGGMGVVYAARQRSLKRLVAIKMILTGPDSDPKARERFRTEAEAVARLQHPNIVQIHEVGEHDGRPFLVLEHIGGGCLGDKGPRAALSSPDAARLMETIALAVHYTHQCGILHRDLKPNNVLLTPDGVPKITDFGVAKLLDAGNATRTEALLGTPNYMSPEQAAGDIKKVGTPADVYSLGAILYELLTGRAPFRGNTILNTLEQVRTREPVAPRKLSDGVPRDLETICLKCLEKNPAHRYPSAEALADDLMRFVNGHPIQARPVPAWERLWRSARRRPALIAKIVGAVAVVCIALSCWWYFRVDRKLAHQRVEDRYQKFVEKRNDALLYGLLAPDQGSLFLGTEANANLRSAEATAREALTLAGVNPESPTPSVDAVFAEPRRTEMAADCYSLLLVLASVRAQQPQPDYEEGLKLLEAARKLGQETRAYHQRRALFLERLSDHDEAKREKERAEAMAPTGALDYFLIGEEQYRRERGDEAARSFGRAVAIQPDHFWAQFYLAVCQLRSEKWALARAGLNTCLAQQPNFVWGHVFRSFAHEKLGELANAEADFDKALRLNPNNDARYVLFLTRGILHFNQSDFDRAEADFRAAIDLKPDQYNAYLNLAALYLVRDRVGDAAEQMKIALWLEPPPQYVFDYHLARGRYLLKVKRYADALDACAAARDLLPDHPLPYDVSGRALLRLGRVAEAEQSFDTCLLKGGEATSDLFRGRGSARMKLGKYAEAADDYTRALERAPDAEIYQHRGWAYFFADAWKLALRDFSRAIDLDPDLGDAYTGRGLAQAMLSNYREAIADAEIALRNRPGTPEMMHNLACVFAQAAARSAADMQLAERQTLAANYRRRALEAVQATLKMLPPAERYAFWRHKILPDAALTPIHDEFGFKKLKDEFGPQ